MEWDFRRRTEGPSARSFVGSLLVHAGVAVLAILATLRAPEPLNFITYEIEIVSPPPLEVQDEEVPAAQEEELVVERPDEAPPEPEVEETPPPVVEEEVVPEPEPEPPVQDTARPEPEPEPREEVAETPTTTEPPEEEAEISGRDLEIRMEGLRTDFPEYYENIVGQIRRCFRPPQGIPPGLRTTVYFVIRANGTVTDLRFVEQSGNPDFDYEALGAIGDCAGQGRFGPLPEELPYERLPIQFTFRPPGGSPDFVPESP